MDKKKIKVNRTTQIGKILSIAKKRGGCVSAFDLPTAFPVRSRMTDIGQKHGLMFSNNEKAKKDCDVVLYRFPMSELERVVFI